MTDVQPIERLALRGRVVRVSEHSNCDVWRGSAINAKGNLQGIYLKMAGQIQLFADVVCSRLAVAAGLPSPKPYLVRCLRGQLDIEFAGAWPWPDDEGLLFATSSLDGAEKFSRFMGNVSDEAVAKKLLGWKHFWDAAWFDEWIANVDRNLGNILVVAPNDFRLIDHDQAFGGAGWPLGDMDCTLPHQNIIADAQVQLLPRDRITANKAFQRASLRFAAIKLRQAIEGVPFLEQKQGIPGRAIDYLTNRLQSLPDLISKRLDNSQFIMPWPTPTSLH